MDNSGKALRSLKVDTRLGWNQLQAQLESASFLSGQGQRTQKGKEEMWLQEVKKWISHLDFSIPFFMVDSPVLSKEMPNHQFVDGVNCRGFEFKIDVLGYPLRGTSWVDPSTALPKQVDMRITNLEYASEDKKVIHFYRTLNFTSTGDEWFPTAMTESIWFVQRSLLKGELFVEEHSVVFE